MPRLNRRTIAKPNGNNAMRQLMNANAQNDRDTNRPEKLWVLANIFNEKVLPRHENQIITERAFISSRGNAASSPFVPPCRSLPAAAGAFVPYFFHMRAIPRDLPKIPSMPEKIVIIGSGPAGWTCAIYAARANIKPLIYEGAISEENRLTNTLPLGQLNLTTDVENYPGFPKGISGPHLMVAMREQAEHYGTRIVTEDIVSLDLSKRPFSMIDSLGKTIHSHSVVIATGASAKYLGIPSEDKYKNMGVSACAVCDGALPRFREKPLIVVGGGDTACEEGNYLTKFASKLYLVHRRDELRASKVMARRLLSNHKVVPLWHSVVDEVLGDDHHGMTGARIKNVKTGETQSIDATGMFVAIGHTPNTKFLKGQLHTDPHGFLKLSDGHRTTTSVEGVFAAGDVADPIYKQAITAAGMGCKAALDAERWLAAQGID
jgi:thioredoxin reductase (NADPH)